MFTVNENELEKLQNVKLPLPKRHVLTSISKSSVPKDLSKPQYRYTYEGEVKNGMYNGKGKLTHFTTLYEDEGDHTIFEGYYTYEGNFKDDKFDGYGIMYDRKGNEIQ